MEGKSVTTQVTNLQSTIDSAKAGDFIFVLPGVLKESITLKDGVSIIAVAPTATISLVYPNKE